MSIEREQVADLRPGDVVELRLDEWRPHSSIVGALYAPFGDAVALAVHVPGGGGCYWIRNANGHPFDGDKRSMRVVSRAPRPIHDCPDCTHMEVPS